MIFYFSATGNCKYVAERIAHATNDTCCSIVESERSEQNTSYNHEKNHIIGIISPTYGLGIPSLVIDFLKSLELDFSDNTYFYFVATYGTTPGHSGYYANKYLKQNTKVEFNAYYSVKMPDTWTPMFDLSDKEKVDEINRNVEPQLDDIISHIQKRSYGDFMKNKIPHFTAFIYKPYYDHMRKTGKFIVEDTCIGCGLCAKRCPINAIEMKDNKPTWVKDKCVMCLGCLHRCPEFAIQYGNKTKKHGQYTNPNVKI